MLSFTVVTLIIVPAYFGFVVFFMLTNLSNQLEVLEDSTTAEVFGLAAWTPKLAFRLVLPVFTALGLLILGTRGPESPLCWNQLLLTKEAFRSFTLLLTLGFGSLYVWSQGEVKSTKYACLDLTVLSFFLALFFAWSSLSAHLLTFLLGLEVITVLLFLTLYYSQLDEGWEAPSNLSWDKGSTLEGSSLILFIWAGAASSILIFWSLGFAGGQLAFWQSPALPLLNATWETQPLSQLLFLSALMLKTGCAPFHFWLLGVYRSLSTRALVAYLLFYYISSLIILFFCLTTLVPLSSSWTQALFFLTLLALNLLWALRLGEATSVGGFVAVSSVLNISLLWLTFLVSLV